jgi:hypothetical protein
MLEKSTSCSTIRYKRQLKVQYQNNEAQWTNEQKKNPGGGEIFSTCPDRPWGPSSLLYYRYRVFPGGRKRPGRDANPSPPSSAEVQKQSKAIPLLSLRAFVGETYLYYNQCKPNGIPHKALPCTFRFFNSCLSPDEDPHSWVETSCLE